MQLDTPLNRSINANSARDFLRPKINLRKPPTKAEEIKILENAIAKLGEDSYLGPWLQGIRAEVQQCIIGDHFPEITLKEADARSAYIVECATLRADSLIASAVKKAERTDEEAQAQLVKAYRDADQIRESGRAALRLALDRL